MDEAALLGLCVGHPPRWADGATYGKEPAVASVSRTKGPIHLGLDVHKDSISVAIRAPTPTSVGRDASRWRREWEGNEAWGDATNHIIPSLCGLGRRHWRVVRDNLSS